MGIELLRTGGSPECASDVLDQDVHRFASPLGGDQYSISILLCRDIADAKIKQVPGQPQIFGRVLAVTGNVGVREGGRSGYGVGRVGDEIVVPIGIASLGHELREHVVFADIKLLEGQRFFHHLGTPVKVVFERPGNRFFQRQCILHRLNIRLRHDPVFGTLLKNLLRPKRIRQTHARA